MVELADTQVLGTCACAYGFESHYPHQKNLQRTVWAAGTKDRREEWAGKRAEKERRWRYEDRKITGRKTDERKGGALRKGYDSAAGCPGIS